MEGHASNRMSTVDEKRLRLNTQHPELIEAMKKLPFPDLTGGNPNARRGVEIRENRKAHLRSIRHLYPIIPGPIPDQVRETETSTLTRDGHEMRMLLYIPLKPPPSGSPLIVTFHEGGWSLGDVSDCNQECRMFTRDLGAVCVNVDYRLAPEYAFPTGVLDAWDAVEWAAKEASPTSSILPADPTQGFIVSGSSAGGNFAAVMAQLARDENLTPPLTGQHLSVPSLIWHTATPSKWELELKSRYLAQSDPILNVLAQHPAIMETLKPDVTSPLFSPLLHPNLENLPPTYLQVCGIDPLLDEGWLYEKELKRNGNLVKMSYYEGMPHMFHQNWPEMAMTRKYLEDIREGVEWLIEVGKSDLK